MTILLSTALTSGLLYCLAAVGLAISFRVLDYPDLTAEGSFIFGGVIGFLSLRYGHPIAALLAAALCGAIAGSLTASIHIFARVGRLLSGIIVAAVLYSVNLRSLGGRPTVRFGGVQTIFTLGDRSWLHDLVILIAVCALITVLLAALFRTRLGLALRAIGDNVGFVVALGLDHRVLLIVGLATANALIALCGAIVVQYKQTCDVGMASGVLITGLAVLMLGEALVPTRTFGFYLISIILGSLAYSAVVAVALFGWSDRWQELVWASDVRAITGALLLIPAAIVKRRATAQRLFRSEW